MTDRSLKFTAFLTIACIGLLSSAPLAGMDLLGSEDLGPAFKPAVTAMTPTAGPVGTQVTIKGTNLSRVTRVVFNPNLTVKATWAGDNKIQVTVPDGAKSGPIMLETHVGIISSRLAFKVAAAE
jgi:hypothetical protein